MSHQMLSFIKSAIRIAGYIMLCHGHPAVGLVLVVE